MNLQAESTEQETDTEVETGDVTTESDAEQASETRAAAAEEEEAHDDGEVVVTIGEESPPSEDEQNNGPAPQWLKDLRKSDREKTKRIRELEEQAKASAPAAKAENALTKPTLADCDYDEEVFETKLTAWHEQQASIKAEQQKKTDAEKAQQAAWQAKLDAHKTAKVALKVSDFDDAEAAAGEALSQTQLGIIVSGADNSAQVVYALGKHPAKLKELSSITDPVKFAFAVAKLETQLKVTQKKTPPAPEKRIAGSAPVSGSVNSGLAKLEAEAERTGDRSKVVAFKREQRRAQQ